MSDADSPKKERRRLARRPSVCEAQVACPTARPRPRNLPPEVAFCPYDSQGVTTVNLSRHGVAFVATRPLPIGAYQTIRIEGGDEPSREEVKVLRCRERDGLYEIAAEFC